MAYTSTCNPLNTVYNLTFKGKPYLFGYPIFFHAVILRAFHNNKTWIRKSVHSTDYYFTLSLVFDITQTAKRLLDFFIVSKQEF